MIGFDANTYSVNESNGSLTVFVQIMQGELKRSVQVEVSLSNGHASGETNRHSYITTTYSLILLKHVE